MLKKFSVKNYKNFKDEITIDFSATAGYQFSKDCITDGLISKLMIYGRNATGKTNLGGAIMDITDTFFSSFRNLYNGILLNADSGENVAGFSYTFDFDGREVVYQYERFDNWTLKSERLMVDDIVIFECDFPNRRYLFDDLKCVQAETANTEIYRNALDEKMSSDEEEETGNTMPFLRWLVNNVALESNSIPMEIMGYARRMSMTTAGKIRNPKVSISIFYDSLEDPKKKKDLEDFLNAMGVDCKLTWRKLPDGHGQLYFSHERLVPFYENASSGTISLVDLYRRIFYRTVEPTLLYLDDFDAFYHYEMADNVMRFIKERYPRCQVIMTTHNTNLMTNELMRPDCLLILSRSGKLTALCNATERELREGHNLEKMYINGEFERYE
ncbi:MAG: ATP-binding protein [Lachnospiraceae bacterium]|nr:ATP-binding protein [Lachnospiraceae bacterium]